MIGQNAEMQNINRDNLISDLRSYKPTEEEAAFLPRFLELLNSDRCFYRDHFNPGHITGSALLINEEKTKILMNYHKSLNKWLSFGGHCDGEEDVFSVAIRETMEESGLTAFKPVTASIVDIDIHTIPANPKRNEPEHEHFDIRYIMQMTEDQKPVISDESLQLQWMTFDEAANHLQTNDSLHRLLEKATITPE